MSGPADDPTPQGDAPPDDIDAQPPGLYVDEEDGPVPEPNEPA